MTLALSGHSVESGIAVGRTHIIQHNELEIGEYRIEADRVEAEFTRLESAVQAARDHLEDLATRLRATTGAAAEEIIRTHIAMLADSSITQATRENIRTQLCNAEWALQLHLEYLIAEFRQIDDDYIRSRADDAVQVVRMVQQSLAAEQLAQPLGDVPDRLVHTLVVASDLTPGELATLHDRGVAGVITEHGSPHSHTAILARSLGVPTVMGVRRGQTLIKEGEQLILDGHYGIVFADPEESILKHYLQKQAESNRFKKSLEAVRHVPAVTRDGQHICLMANAEREDEITQALQSGAEGVGLFRSEFLFLQGSSPGEEEQFRAYRQCLDALGNRPLTIRTLDLGADKTADLINFATLKSIPNSALGLRAVRLCLRELELFKTQLRAILRVSAHGRVRCLIPMLTSAREVQAVRALLDEIAYELEQEGIAFDANMELGGMIEVPAAALSLETLCRQLDFVSVGTNDLIQYALATDRVDEHVAHLYDPLHPGVIHLLHHVFTTSRRLKMPIAVCGELAGDRRYTRLLLALGLRDFSMQSRYLLQVKQVITETDVTQAEAALAAWLAAAPDDGRAPLTHFLDQSQLSH